MPSSLTIIRLLSHPGPETWRAVLATSSERTMIMGRRYSRRALAPEAEVARGWGTERGRWLGRRIAAMSSRSVERKLRKTSTRLSRLRDELAVIDEQLAHLVDDTEDKSVRALVADSPFAAVEHSEAIGHSEAMAAHKRHVVAEIGALEVQQDKLLDELRLL